MSNEHVKIAFTLDADEWHKTPVETLWARPVGGDDARAFELDNTPFFAKGISYRDIVLGVEVDGMLEFAGVVEGRGHSTYRIAFEQQSDMVASWWARLEELGCSREAGDCRGLFLYAIDVPPEADIDAICAILASGEETGIWMYEIGHDGRKDAAESMGRSN